MTTADQNPQVCRRDRALWLQCASTALVALGATYASYRHGREFALRYGGDDITAGIWPVMVDGLLTVATVELWRTERGHHRGGQWKAWVAFLFGISLSFTTMHVGCSGSRCTAQKRPETGTSEPRCCRRWLGKPFGVAIQTRD